MAQWTANLPDVFATAQKNYPDKKLEIYFEDEARFGQKGYLVRGWYPRGTRPEVIKQNRFSCAYITTAASPSTGKNFSIITSCMDSTIMQCFLSEFSENLEKDTVAFLILDQAAWHKTKTLLIPDNIRLHFLPPYSPQLNPIENLWQYVKSNFLSTRVYKDLEAIITTGCSVMSSLTKEIIQSVCHRDFCSNEYLATN